MFVLQEKQDSLELKMSSSMEMVDRAVEQSRLWLHNKDEEAIFGLKILLRELLTNAMEHGNKLDSEKETELIIQHLSEDKICVEVKDQGAGFDWEKLEWAIKEDTASPRQRGLAMVNRYADDVEFKNGGSTVRAWYRIPQKTAFGMIQEGRINVVRPEGAISATNAEDFRQLLVDLLNQGASFFQFDFSNVPEIDSMGLSVLLSFGHLVQEKYQNSEYQLLICGMGSELRMLLEFTHANRYYELMNEVPATENGK